MALGRIGRDVGTAVRESFTAAAGHTTPSEYQAMARSGNGGGQHSGGSRQSYGGGSRQSSGGYASARSGGGRAADGPLKYRDIYKPMEYHRHRRNIELVLIGLGLLSVFFAKPFSLVFCLGVLCLALAIAWLVMSPSMHRSDIKLVRKLSLKADKDFDAEIDHYNYLMERLIEGGALNNALVKDFWLKPIELDLDDPWAFYFKDTSIVNPTEQNVQAVFDKIKGRIQNEDGVYAYRVKALSRRDDGHLWREGDPYVFKVLIFFSPETAAYAEGVDITNGVVNGPQPAVQANRRPNRSSDNAGAGERNQHGENRRRERSESRPSRNPDGVYVDVQVDGINKDAADRLKNTDFSQFTDSSYHESARSD